MTRSINRTRSEVVVTINGTVTDISPKYDQLTNGSTGDNISILTFIAPLQQGQWTHYTDYGNA